MSPTARAVNGDDPAAPTGGIEDTVPGTEPKKIVPKTLKEVTGEDDEVAEGENESAPPKKTYKRSRTTRDQSESEADRRRVRLTTGEDRTIDVDFDVSPDRTFVGNPQIVASTAVKVGEKRQVTLKPLKAGETTLTFRDEKGGIRLVMDVQVSGTNLLRRAGEIRDLIKDVDGVEVRIVGQKIVVDGEVLVPNDYARVLGVISDKAYADLIINLATLSPLAMNLLSKRIETDIQVYAPDVKTRVVNGIVFLEGTVDNVDKANQAFEVAKLYLPEARPGNQLVARDATAQLLSRPAVKNFIKVNAPPPKKQEKLVRVTVHFVKLAKDYGKFFGFKWQPGFTSDGPTLSVGNSESGALGASTPTLTATISNLFPKLLSAQTAGYARVLRTGTVITRSGQPGTITEQTTIPFLVPDANGRAVNGGVSVGVAVNVTPQILGQSEDISLDLNLDQTSVAQKGSGDRAPATTRHTVQTKLYVKSQDSAAVGSVQSSDVSTFFNKDDPSQKAPAADSGTEPLFTLLRSKTYNKTKSQYVIFVTPQIIENASEGTDDLKRNFRVKVK